MTPQNYNVKPHPVLKAIVQYMQPKKPYGYLAEKAVEDNEPPVESDFQ